MTSTSRGYLKFPWTVEAQTDHLPAAPVALWVAGGHEAQPQVNPRPLGQHQRLITVVSLIFQAVSANWVAAMTQACCQDGESDLEAHLWSRFKAESGHRSPNTRPMYTRNRLSVTDLCVADL